ncbi:MAG: YggT family protein [Anaerolineae bacterium]|jgi:YggT family protein|nr:YggT family protein [Anaerolineae bacterium]
MIILSIISLALSVYSFILLARVLMTWFPNVDPSHPVVRFLYEATEPVLAPVRQLLPPMAGLDLSPVVVLVAISLIRTLILRV